MVGKIKEGVVNELEDWRWEWRRSEEWLIYIWIIIFGRL